MTDSNSEQKRTLSTALKRGYSENELAHMYELARFLLETGGIEDGTVILKGINAVAPNYVPALLALCHVHVISKNHTKALQLASRAVELEPESVDARLFLISAHLLVRDLQTAGTMLGEVGEAIESGINISSAALRLYRAHRARFETI